MVVIAAAAFITADEVVFNINHLEEHSDRITEKAAASLVVKDGDSSS